MQFKILGCGSSMGVPKPDGDFVNCNPKEKKNYRTRCSALIKTKKMNILIDTSPDLRSQLINNKIKNIDKVNDISNQADELELQKLDITSEKGLSKIDKKILKLKRSF